MPFWQRETAMGDEFAAEFAGDILYDCRRKESTIARTLLETAASYIEA